MPSPAKMDVCAGLNSKLPTCIIWKARRRIQIRTAMPFPRWHSSTFHFSPNRSPCIPPELPIHHQRRAPHNYRTPIESGILSCLSSTPYNSEKSSNYTPRKRQNSFHWHFLKFLSDGDFAGNSSKVISFVAGTVMSLQRFFSRSCCVFSHTLRRTQTSINISASVSTTSLIRRRNKTASRPSTMRWS
jgi:hypothetical protein